MEIISLPFDCRMDLQGKILSQELHCHLPWRADSQRSAAAMIEIFLLGDKGHAHHDNSWSSDYDHF